MAYNVVTNYSIINEIKRCRYFKINLGLAATMDKAGNRVLNDKDRFSYYYNSLYKTTILGQGNVGDIKFYTDHMIREPIMAVYCGPNNEEFIFDVDFKVIKEKGIDNYLGYIMKEVEEKHEERIKTETEKKMEPVKVGNPDMVTMNPGSVTYNDLKAYLEQQNKNRYSV